MPDARGHGQSPSPDSAYTSELHAADIAALIQELGLGQPPVVGHSMGAMNAMYIAANHAETVSAVVLVDPPWRNDDQLRTAEFWQKWREGLTADKALSDSDLVAKIQGDNPRWHIVEAETKAEAIRQFDVRTFDLYTLTRRPWEDVLPKVQCPALLLYADAGIVTSEVAAQAEALAPKLVAQCIVDCGHSIQREQFEDFITAVQDYLKRLA
jgi:N-formylmaleamate deformylase